MKFPSTLLLLSVFSFPAFALQCGDTVTTTVKMTKDLDCSSYSGFAALNVKGNGILKGQGKKIISPNTSVGIYAEGQTVKIMDVEIQGSTEATGISGYNVVRLVVDNVKASGMNIGVNYYTEVEYDCDRLKVVDSDLSGNNIGAKVVSPQCEYFPRFARTDFSNSYQWALNLQAKKLRIREIQDNTYDGSANGLSLKASETITVDGLDLASAQIDGVQISAYNSPQIKITDVTVGNNQSVGIDLYDVADIEIRRTEAVGAGVGIKVATEQVSSKLLVQNSKTSQNGTAGLLVTSYGAKKLQSIDISKKNSFLDFVSIQNQ